MSNIHAEIYHLHVVSFLEEVTVVNSEAEVGSQTRDGRKDDDGDDDDCEDGDGDGDSDDDDDEDDDDDDDNDAYVGRSSAHA